MIPDPELTELARLRAEVGRLQAAWLECEGISALEAHGLEPTPQNVSRLINERDESLAQVAVLYQKLAKHGGHRDDHCTYGEIVEAPTIGMPKKPCVCGLESDIPTEARALLDRLNDVETDAVAFATQLTQVKGRLQRAEAVVEAAKTVVAQCSGHMTPSMGDLFKLEQALAAWEEGKA